jgi:hypothetical protein
LGGPVQQNGDPECVCVPSLAGLIGTGLQSEYSAVLCRPWGHGRQSRDRAGLGGLAQPNGAPIGLCRPGGGRGGLVETINVCGSLALRARPTEILVVLGVEFGVAQPWWGKGAGSEVGRS